MTAVNLGTGSDIPSNCNTLEKIHAWSGIALARLNPNAKILQNPDASPTRVVDTVLIKADQGGYRFVIQSSLPVRDSYPESPTKFWENITEVDTVALPTAYKSN